MLPRYIDMGTFPLNQTKYHYHGRKIQRVSDPFKHGEEHRFSIHLCCKRLQFKAQGIEQEKLIALQDVSH